MLRHFSLEEKCHPVILFWLQQVDRPPALVHVEDPTFLCQRNSRRFHNLFRDKGNDGPVNLEISS
jgi:hypothetical protein